MVTGTNTGAAYTVVGGQPLAAKALAPWAASGFSGPVKIYAQICLQAPAE
jgi:hypothetical protein